MAQNLLNSINQNPPRPTHSRSISTISNHQKNISFMPKFLLKALHRRKPSHRRSLSNSIPVNGMKKLKDPGTKNDEKVEKNKRKHKYFPGNTQLMQLIPDPKRITSMMSTLLFRNHNKLRDQEQCKDHKPRNLARQVSKESRSNEVPCSTSTNCKFGFGNVVSSTVNGERMSREKTSKTAKNSEVKGGLKIKRIVKLKSRERQKTEKRFELCKKKILMGEKCRPLHGSLHYDKNGVLVPEEFS